MVLGFIIFFGIIFSQDPPDPPDAVTKVSTSAANWLKIESGVRGIAMAGAQAAAGRGLSGVYYNPASIAYIEGSEAYFSNKLIADLFRNALSKYNINKNYVQFIKSRDRKLVDLILSKMENYIDVVIPRGGKNLVKKVQKISSVPVIGHLEGICHTYIDKDANLNLAKKIVLNAKLRNTSICGATETILIHEKNLNKYVNPVLDGLVKNGCIIYSDKKIKKIFKGKSRNANQKSWSTEYLSAKVSVKSVKNVSEAIKHINKYGTMHTDAIISKNKKTAKYFLKNVKSSIAIHNSSTQFADGGEFGFGGEVGISTNKLPPRGPVGLNQLVTYKYEVLGKGQIRK